MEDSAQHWSYWDYYVNKEVFPFLMSALALSIVVMLQIYHHHEKGLTNYPHQKET